MVGAWGLRGCITLLMPAAKKGTRSVGSPATASLVPCSRQGGGSVGSVGASPAPAGGEAARRTRCRKLGALLAHTAARTGQLHRMQPRQLPASCSAAAQQLHLGCPVGLRRHGAIHHAHVDARLLPNVAVLRGLQAALRLKSRRAAGRGRGGGIQTARRTARGKLRGGGCRGYRTCMTRVMPPPPLSRVQASCLHARRPGGSCQ